jgi:hypothetical protein
MSAIMRDLVRMTLARSLYVAGAFAATLALFVLADQAPERSVWDWILLASVLGLLSLLGGLIAAFVELRQQ